MSLFFAYNKMSAWKEICFCCKTIFLREKLLRVADNYYVCSRCRLKRSAILNDSMEQIKCGK